MRGDSVFSIFKSLYFIGFLILYAALAVLVATTAYPFVVVVSLVWDPAHLWLSLFAAAAGLIFGLASLMLVMAIAIRAIGWVFPLRPGTSSVYGTRMMIWAVQYLFMNFMNTWFLSVLRTTPLLNVFYRVLGARVGHNVFFNSSYVYEPHLVEIGANSRIGENAVIVPHTTEGKEFICKRITVGKDVTIGQYAQILPGAVIGDGAIIGAGTVVPKDYVVEPYTVQAGNPIRMIRRRAERPARQAS